MRNLSQFFTRQTLSYLLYLPKVFFVVKNPLRFLKAYITGDGWYDQITLRNGLVYDVANFDDMGVFYEIFIKGEYGSIPQGKINVIDIGANNGLFALYCTYKNPHAQIHCCEPVPACAEHIRQMSITNNLHNIHVHQLAVSDKEWTQNLYLGDQTVAASLYEGIASGHNAITIKTDTLENIIHRNNLGKVDFLKVDCEGGEYDIFYSTSVDTLNRCAYMAIEYHDIDEEKNGRKLYEYIKDILGETRNVRYHHHPAHPHNGFITVK